MNIPSHLVSLPLSFFPSPSPKCPHSHLSISVFYLYIELTKLKYVSYNISVPMILKLQSIYKYRHGAIAFGWVGSFPLLNKCIHSLYTAHSTKTCTPLLPVLPQALHSPFKMYMTMYICAPFSLCCAVGS